MAVFLFTDQLVRWEEKYNTWRQMVRIEDRGSSSECESEGQENKRTRRGTSVTSNNEIHGQVSKQNRKWKYIREKTETLLLKYYPSPIEILRDVEEFKNDNMLTDPTNDKMIAAAFLMFGKKLIDYKLRDFEDLLDREDFKPIFNPDMNYGSLQESVDVLAELLNFQFDENEEDICHFLTSLVDIIDKRLMKTNALCILSPPNGGKNFFFDMIYALLMNKGQLSQANKHNVFAFQDAPGRRIIEWNEPNYESCLTDTLKLMMAGDAWKARVKHCADMHVSRTPIIITTNNRVNFMTDPAFKSRIIQFRWKEAKFLKDVNIKPHPMSLFLLLNKYNILY